MKTFTALLTDTIILQITREIPITELNMADHVMQTFVEIVD